MLVLNTFLNNHIHNIFNIGFETVFNGAHFQKRMFITLVEPQTVGADQYRGRKDVVSVVFTGVTAIGTRAFKNCTHLKTVVIPDSVTSIGRGAFANCASIETVDIPDSIGIISSNTFYNCIRLRSVRIPDSVTTIGTGAFVHCTHLGSVVVPDSVTTIGAKAFHTCYQLRSLTIGHNVVNIGSSAFGYCKQLASVILPPSVTNIDFAAFVGSKCVIFAPVGFETPLIGVSVYCTPLGTLLAHYAHCLDNRQTMLVSASKHSNPTVRGNNIVQLCGNFDLASDIVVSSQGLRQAISDLPESVQHLAVDLVSSVLGKYLVRGHPVTLSTKVISIETGWE